MLPLAPLIISIAATLPFLRNYALGALTNRTIEDFDAAVDYGNCTIAHCDATPTQQNPCLLPGFGGFTLTNVEPSNELGCRVKVSFIGTAIYAYLGCPPSANCEFQLDNTAPHANINATTNEDIIALAYSNASLSTSNNPHTLLISSTGDTQFLVDKFIYTFDDGLNPTSASLSMRSQSSMHPITINPTTNPTPSPLASQSSLPPPPAPSLTPSNRSNSHINIAGILGGAIGGILLGAMTVFAFHRRCCLSKKTHHRSHLEPYPPTSSALSTSSAANPSPSASRWTKPRRPVSFRNHDIDNSHPDVPQAHALPGELESQEGSSLAYNGYRQQGVPDLHPALANPPPTIHYEMVQPLSLLPRSVVAGALAGLLGLQHGARAVHVNHTIEDSDIVNFGCTVTACDATSTQYDPCNENNVENRTFTIVTPVFDSCSLKVPFNGIAIYAFVSCTTLPGCQVEVDKIGDTGWPQSYVIQTDPAATVLPLGYFNDSLSNGPHILTISSTEFFLVDKFIYTYVCIPAAASATKLTFDDILAS
ncbi:hypothetical protein R3P38DRAFT_3262932 [Favolaschia claudopus]|uniref:Uncharacterized protein n=1 Tax=Favolaschia claudopus TaxID=2862362 RepID=A0AAW0CI60_9AGAR